MLIDIITAGVGLASFSVLLLGHLIVFRFIKPEDVLRFLMTLLALTSILPVVVIEFLIFSGILSVAWLTGACMVFLAFLMHVLLSFIYIICVVGFYETSVRMRLVREIAHAGRVGIDVGGILKHYNPEVITRLRMQRLIGSGDIVEKDGFYKIASKINFFFVLNIVSTGLKRWLS